MSEPSARRSGLETGTPAYSSPCRAPGTLPRRQVASAALGRD
jgi:hypothetical protein